MRGLEQLLQDERETAIALGHEIDALWRKYSHDWLRRCDDPHYLAEWFDKHTFSDRHTPYRSACAATTVTAYHLAGNDHKATELLSRVIEESEIPYEVEFAREMSLVERLPPFFEWLFRLVDGPPSDPKIGAAKRSAVTVKLRRKYGEDARKLADGLGIRL